MWVSHTIHTGSHSGHRVSVNAGHVPHHGDLCSGLLWCVGVHQVVESDWVGNHGQVRVEEGVSHGFLELLVPDDGVEASFLEGVVQVDGESLESFENDEFHMGEFGVEFGGPEVGVLDVFLAFVLAWG